MTNRTRFMYLRDEKNSPHTCVAMRVNPETSTIEYAVSICYPTDTFIKENGRFIACRRLDKHPEVIKDVDCASLTCHEIMSQVVSAVAEQGPCMKLKKINGVTMPTRYPGLPMRTRRAASRWLQTSARERVTVPEVKQEVQKVQISA